MLLISAMASLICLGNPASGPKDFWDFWGDGKAELSSYSIVTPRYGEMREGYEVFIFVTEEISRKTRIKVESDAIPQKDRVPVLKLNRVTRFTTGIYDYALLTSVFSSVENEFGRGRFDPLKISFSGQEWCGHVFQMLTPDAGDVRLQLMSYFQSEGNVDRTLSLPENAVFEDNLPIWIRELRGEVMAAGEERSVQILPSSWSSRRGHTEVRFLNGKIRKSDGGTLAVDGADAAVWKWEWQAGQRTETYFVEKTGQSRIVRFSSTDGTRGELQASFRAPYWRLHDNADLPYRDRLKIGQ